MQIDADIPGGNGIVERIDGDEVFVRPDLRDTEGFWFYWHFRVRGAAGRTLRFHLTSPKTLAARGAAVSLDGGWTWAWKGPEDFAPWSFSHCFGEGERDARFSMGMPYTEAQWRRFAAELAGRKNVRLETLCLSRKGRTVELLRAGCVDSEPRFRVLVAARHHACEMMASYALEGLARAVLEDDPAGRWLRRHVELAFVPFADKDGVEDGDQGKNRRPHDHNRDYSPPSLYPETRALRERIPRWSDGKLAAALDLHCPYIVGKEHNEHIYQVGSSLERAWKEQQAFGRILESRTAAPEGLPYRSAGDLPFGQGWNKPDRLPSDLKNFAAWAAELPGVRLASTIEIPYAWASEREVNQTTARAFGRTLAAAIRDYLD